MRASASCSPKIIGQRIRQGIERCNELVVGPSSSRFCGIRLCNFRQEASMLHGPLVFLRGWEEPISLLTRYARLLENRLCGFGRRFGEPAKRSLTFRSEKYIWKGHRTHHNRLQSSCTLSISRFSSRYSVCCVESVSNHFVVNFKIYSLSIAKLR